MSDPTPEVLAVAAAYLETRDKHDVVVREFHLAVLAQDRALDRSTRQLEKVGRALEQALDSAPEITGELRIDGRLIRRASPQERKLYGPIIVKRAEEPGRGAGT